MRGRLISRCRGSPFAFALAALTARAMGESSEDAYQDAKATFNPLCHRGTAGT